MAPVVMERLGNCGGIVPGGNRLPILIGEPVDRCPAAMGADEEVRLMTVMLPNINGPGLIGKAELSDLPPFWREAKEMALAWIAEYRMKVPDA